MENYSQAIRVARHLFGPLARVGVNMDAAPATGTDFVVSIQGKRIGLGVDFKAALEDAMVTATAAAPHGGRIDGVILDTRVDVVAHRRHALLQELPPTFPEAERQGVINGIFGLHDHEVFAVQKLSRDSVEAPLALRDVAVETMKKMLTRAAQRLDTRRPRTT